MLEFFTTLETVLLIENPKDKLTKFNEFYKLYKDDKLTFNHNQTSTIFEYPSYINFCRVVPPKDVLKRKNLDTKEGKAILLHSILHIEYSAIDLALDASYRFKNMPKKFYDDWLEVADDEVRHFLMVEEILNELGFSYSDFAVHTSLFDASKKSLDLISRMATVPRYLEANGLDANPKIIHKLKSIGDKFSLKMAEALEIILNEEITHVKKGDYWFKYGCNHQEIKKCDYFAIVEKVLPGSSKKRKFVNREARLQAGFSEEEIEKISY